jgi:cytochrome c oxidase subunit 2
VKGIIVGLVGAVLGCVLGWIMLLLGPMPPQASVQAVNTDWLFDIMVITVTAIFGLVTAVLFAAIFLFRERPGSTRTPSASHGHTRLEIVWTLIPTIIVVALAVLAYGVMADNDASATAKGAIKVTVWGQKWDWTYDYPELGLQAQHELVIPVDANIRFEIQSRDVIHGWWVPDWRIQQNATPGQINVLSVRPTKLGTFKVVCTFICGDGHPRMGTGVAGAFPQRVRVVTAAQYAVWLKKAQAVQKAADADPNAKAVKVFTANGCGACHAWGPAKSTGGIGPSLDGIAASAKGAGMPVADYVKQSILQPSAVVVGGFGDLMPKDLGTKISDQDLAELVKRIAAGGTK